MSFSFKPDGRPAMWGSTSVHIGSIFNSLMTGFQHPAVISYESHVHTPQASIFWRHTVGLEEELFMGKT